MNDSPANTLVGLTAEVVSAYVRSNPISSDTLPRFIRDVHASLYEISNDPVGGAKPQKAPAVDPAKSVKPNYIICLEDGKQFKSLKRHLAVLGMTPSEYRDKWNLPYDYPMVAPDYSAARSKLAKSSGLGLGGGRPPALRRMVGDRFEDLPTKSTPKPKTKVKKSKTSA